MTAVALVLDGPRPPAWQAAAAERIAASRSLRLVELRLAESARGENALWRGYRAVERRLFGIAPDALAPTDAPEALAEGGAAPDLIVWLAASPAPPDALTLRHDGCGDASTAFRRAVACGAATVTTEALLGERVVARSVSGVRPFSATLAANLALWKAAALVARAAEAPEAAGASGASQAPACRAPHALPFIARAAWRWGRVLAVRLLFRRPWQVLVRPRAEQPLEGWQVADGELVEWRPGHLYADPVLFEHEGRHHLFVEDVPPGTGRGVISHVELVAGERCGPPRPVLEAEHHLSYPFVFAHGDDVFLMPESSAARCVEIHRAVEYPRVWRHERTLLEGLEVADATLLEHDGRWWLFAAVAAPGASLLDELHLFSSDSPLGEWTPHPLNPVVSDVRAARPAGPVVRDGERLLRPAQDGSRRYGWALSLREIETLTPEAYAEREVARLEPAQLRGARAVHAYSRDSRFEAIDVRRRVLRLR